MTVAPLLFSCLLYGAIGIAVGGIAIMYVRDGRPKLPDAMVVGAPSRAGRRWLSRIAPWIMVGVGAVGAIWLYTQSHAVVIVTDDGARRAIEVGSAPPDPNHHVWVVNRSTHAVRVEVVQYGLAIIPSTPSEVPPGVTLGFSSIDDLGPDDPPPKEIRETTDIPIDSRNWLTWD